MKKMVRKTVRQLKITYLKTRRWKNFLKNIRPKVRFGDIPPPPPPNYSDVHFWAAHPNVPNKSSVLLPGATPAPESALKADVFYIYPTAYFGDQNWNADTNNPKVNELVKESMLAAQASVFNHCCKVYAPFYRQATFFSFFAGKKHGRKALELAYEDVKSAFLHFYHHFNQGRPYFIAGHSQGSLHAIRLLEEVIDALPYAQNLVAAYPIGFRYPLDKAQNHSYLKINESPLDLQSIIAWDTYRMGGQPHTIQNRMEHYYDGKWQLIRGRPVVGINPLNWTRSRDQLPKTLNKGGAVTDFKNFKFKLAHLSDGAVLGLNAVGLLGPFPEEVFTQLGPDGILYISKPHTPLFSRLVLPFGNYHNYDYSLFYLDMRANILNKLDRYLSIAESGSNLPG